MWYVLLILLNIFPNYSKYSTVYYTVIILVDMSPKPLYVKMTFCSYCILFHSKEICDLDHVAVISCFLNNVNKTTRRKLLKYLSSYIQGLKMDNLKLLDAT
jgi:hypothetical protein